MHLAKKIGFFCAFTVPSVTVLAFYFGGGLWNYATVVYVFIVIPLLDEIIGKDSENPTEAGEKALSHDFFFKYITFLWVPVHFALIFWAFQQIEFAGLLLYEKIGLMISVALSTGGLGITVAHELGHKHTKTEKFLAKTLLVSVFYGHFYVEHNRGHHLHVGTPKDPATSRFGENFYTFWLRTVKGSFESAWRIEKERLQKKGKSAFSFENEVLLLSVVSLLYFAILWAFFSFSAEKIAWEFAFWYPLHAVAAFSLLEVVNYIEHYGIVRRKTASGKYEKVEHVHSWNANHLLSNLFLFQLQRHSDHHAHAHRRYQVLRHFEDSPQLPFGYPVMILAALVPPVWFYLMNPRLKAWEKQVYEHFPV
jgi:alkane 1-monooxygenase